VQRRVRSLLFTATGLLWGCHVLAGLDDFAVEPNGRGGAGGQGGASRTSTGGGGDVAPALEDEGLVARYFLDDDRASPRVADAAPTPVDLSIVLDDMQEPALVGMEGRRALQWSIETSWGRPWIPSVGGTKLYARLHDSELATLEIVVRLQSVNELGSRLLHFGSNTEPGRLSLRMGMPGELRYYVNDVPIATGKVPMGQRVVIHGVLDARMQVSPAALYLNGEPVSLTQTGFEGPIDLDDCHFAIGNRRSDASDGRSFRGRIYYAAVYDVAFTPTRVKAHAGHLLESDDTPD